MVTYVAWSVVFGEQPSAAKWNIIGTNMVGFNDGTALGDDIIHSRHIAWGDTGAVSGDNGGIWWEELGRTTLSGAGDTITISSLPARKYLKVYIKLVSTGGTILQNITFNNDTGNNYVRATSANGAADVTSASQSNFGLSAAQADTQFTEMEFENTATQEKVGVFRLVQSGAAGAGAMGTRREGQLKWANTSAQITRIDVTNTGTGDYAIGSELIVLGHD